MQANSRLPASAQGNVHEHLAARLERHCAEPFRKPYADYNRAAFADSMARRRRMAPGILGRGSGGAGGRVVHVVLHHSGPEKQSGASERRVMAAPI